MHRRGLLQEILARSVTSTLLPVRAVLRSHHERPFQASASGYSPEPLPMVWNPTATHRRTLGQDTLTSWAYGRSAAAPGAAAWPAGGRVPRPALACAAPDGQTPAVSATSTGNAARLRPEKPLANPPMNPPKEPPPVSAGRREPAPPQAPAQPGRYLQSHGKLPCHVILPAAKPTRDGDPARRSGSPRSGGWCNARGTRCVPSQCGLPRTGRPRAVAVLGGSGVCPGYGSAG